MFIVPRDTPGITITNIKSWGDHAYSEVFFTDARIPANHLIGQVDNGWNTAMGAVGGERMFGGFAGGLRKIMDDFIEHCRTVSFEGQLLAARPEAALGLARLEIDLEIADLISLDICSRVDAGVRYAGPTQL